MKYFQYLIVLSSLFLFLGLTSCTKEEDKGGCETRTITLPDGSSIEQPIPGTCDF